MTQKLKGRLWAWLCAFAALGLFASVSPSQRYSFRGTTEGLGDLNVNCIAQDRSGYLWLGTENGLYRYDGSQFRQYGAAEGLRTHTIQSLFSGLDGTLFVGTTSGIFFQLQNGNFGEVQPPGTLNQFSLRIGTLFTSNSPDQVVAADRSGAYLLRHVETDRWAAEPMHLDATAIWSVQYGPGGVLWYGCDSDLCTLNAGKTTHIGAALHLPEDQWRHLLLTRSGHIWIRGTTHIGEIFPAENRFEPRELPVRSSAVSFDALAEDAQGRIAASQGPAFGLWENGHWRMVTARNGLTRYDLSALFVDRENSLWIGVVGHGFQRWVGEDHWEAYTTAEGLSNDIVWMSLRDRTGRLWICTESGLDYIPAGGDTPVAWQSAGIATDRAVSLTESANGNIWVGSAAGSVIRIDSKTLAGKKWDLPETYRVLSEGSHLWMATDAGLYKVDTAAADQTPQLVEDPAIPNPRKRFTDLSLDIGNRVWAASDEGLFRLDGNGWRRIDPGLSGINPYQIAADRDGNVWAAGAFAGVVRLRISGDRIVESEHILRPKLLSEQVVSLMVDHRGWLWVGQDAGLTIYDSHSWRSFTQDDGLIWNDLDSFALSEDPDGSLWIGTSGGLAHLMQPQTASPESPQVPVLSGMTFGGTDIANKEQIPWSASPLTVSLASLSFRNAHHIHMRYRLLGLETEWVETAQKSVRYARLDPGLYRFQAEALDGNGGVSPIAEITFRITPRWWQSNLLRLVVALLAGIAVVLVWRGRIQLLVAQKRQLEMAVDSRTEDLQREKIELVHAQERMRHFAEHDDLTGLWNHRIIIDRLRQEVDRARRDGTPLSLILADLDHFKEINDTYGHPAGDLVLKEISAILQRSVRTYDWVGRYGGEEFLLILPGSSFVNTRIRAEQFRMAVQTARILDGDTVIQVSASFGVASGFPTDFETMIHVADAALYQAKNNGRNCVVATEIEPPATPGTPTK